jgi:hypothetical protein
MTEVQPTISLQRLMAKQDTDCATGVLEDGREIVTLGVVDRGEIEVVLDGVVQVVRPEILVTPVDELERMVMLLRTASKIAHDSRRTAETEFTGVLERVRDYAIARHEEGEFCREGLNEFLRTFGWPEYNPDQDEEDDKDEGDDEEQ